MSGERDSVLVVDDEESVRNLLQRILKEAGYAVDSAANGQEALEIMAQMRPGVVLLDIKMPGMSGIEVLKQITATWPDTGVIMATAVTDTQTAINTMKLGAYDYIGKPFNRDDLLVKVKRAFEKRVLLLENEHHRFDLERRLGDQTEQLQQQFVSSGRSLSPGARPAL